MYLQKSSLNYILVQNVRSDCWTKLKAAINDKSRCNVSSETKLAKVTSKHKPTLQNTTWLTYLLQHDLHISPAHLLHVLDQRLSASSQLFF